MPGTKLVIIGGVAGGATAAARARRLSEEAEIVLLERGPYVSFANCGLPYYISGEISNRSALLVQTPERLKARYNIDVRVHHEAIAVDRVRKSVTVRNLADDRTYTEPYDYLILAPGAAPLRPALPGVDHPRVFTLRSIPDTDRIKSALDAGSRSAVVVGGGYIGLEMAEALRRRGLHVDLVEALDQVMPPLDREMAADVHRTLLRNGIRLRLGDSAQSFADEDGRVRVCLRSGAAIAADMVVLSIGIRPESELARKAGLDVDERGGIRVNDRMQTSDPAVYAVGDAVTVRDPVTGLDAILPLAGPANRQARIAADNIFGRGERYRGTLGTAIVRVFDLVVAMTGANEKTLRRAGLQYEKIYIHPNQHAGYYPGAMPMSLKLLFAPPEGRILGAQITGREGVDKRIDVLATAMHAGLTVFDLEHLELAYAPPFGAAKDPINMAGFVASNVLRGDVAIAHADALGDALLLDVREPAEHQAGAIPGSKLIPLNQLRARHSELPTDRPVVAYCQVGLRGYLAARILRQLGYDVRNLSGGYRTWSAFNPPPVTEPCPPPEPPPANDRGETVRPGSPTSPGKPDPASCVTLDVRGKRCPGPIVGMTQALQEVPPGGVLRVLSDDAGFAADVAAWCRTAGNELLGLERADGHCIATIRRSACAPASSGSAAAPRSTDKTIIVFSNDLDRVLASFVIANGAAAMGQKVTMFFTFWGLNVLRRPDPPRVSKRLLDRMFGWMMPRGPARLTLSKMHMGGLGTALMKHVMRSKAVPSLPDLMAQARAAGVRMVACSMSMEVMGIGLEELVDNVEVGGVAAFLASADASNVTLFV